MSTGNPAGGAINDGIVVEKVPVLQEDEYLEEGIEEEEIEEEVEEEEIEEEIEEEVTDNEEATSDVPSSAVLLESPEQSVKGKAAEKPSAEPAVKSVARKEGEPSRKMAPRRALGDVGGVSPNQDILKKNIPTGRNPFDIFGDWNRRNMKEVEIMFPVIGASNETTNDLTRKTRPEARYWKAPIVFKHGEYVSERIRFNNIHVPYISGRGYGTNYVYLALPGFLGELMSSAAKARGPTKVSENNLVPSKEIWWKTVSDVESKFGVLRADSRKFHSNSLETIFESSHKGFKCSVILLFKYKASTTDSGPVKGTTPRTITVELERGFISQLDVEVQPPTRVQRTVVKKEPVAMSSDVASDSLMERLAQLGL